MYKQEVKVMKAMRDVRVVPTSDGKWKVLINFIQRGVEYINKEIADHEMERIIKEKIA